MVLLLAIMNWTVFKKERDANTTWEVHSFRHKEHFKELQILHNLLVICTLSALWSLLNARAGNLQTTFHFNFQEVVWFCEILPIESIKRKGIAGSHFIPPSPPFFWLCLSKWPHSFHGFSSWGSGLVSKALASPFPFCSFSCEGLEDVRTHSPLAKSYFWSFREFLWTRQYWWRFLQENNHDKMLFIRHKNQGRASYTGQAEL